MLPPPTSAAVPPGVDLVAQVTGPQVAVYENPARRCRSRRSRIPGCSTVPPTGRSRRFVVEEQRQDGWVHVLLAERPNGSAGWIRQSDVNIVPVPYHVEVNLGAHEIRFFKALPRSTRETLRSERPRRQHPPVSLTSVCFWRRRRRAVRAIPVRIVGLLDVLTSSTVVTARSACTATTTRRCSGRA